MATSNSDIYLKDTSTSIENGIFSSSNCSSSEKGLSYVTNLTQENALNSLQLQKNLEERQKAVVHQIYLQKEEKIKNKYFSNGETYSGLEQETKEEICNEFMHCLTKFIMKYAINYYHNIKKIPFADYIKPIDKKDTVVHGKYQGKTTDQLIVKDFLQLSGDNMNLGDDIFLGQSYRTIKHFYWNCIKEHLEKINV